MLQLESGIKAQIGSFFRENERLNLPTLNELVDFSFSSLTQFDSFVENLLTSIIVHCIIDGQTIDKELGDQLELKLCQYDFYLKRGKVILARRAINALVNKKPLLLNMSLTDCGFLLVDPNRLSPQGSSFQLPYFIEMMSLAFLFGLFTKSRLLIDQACSMALASLHLLNRHGEIPIGPCSISSDSNSQVIQTLHAATIRAIYSMTKDKILYEVSSQINSHCNPTLDTLSPFCRALVEALISHQPNMLLPPLKYNQDHTLGFVNLSDFDASLIVDCYGQGTSFGYIEMNGIEIRAFGLQYAPLGDMKTFGTYRMEGTTAFSSKLIEAEEVTTYSDWTRIHDPNSSGHKPVPGKVFAHIGIIKKQKELRLKIKLAQYDLKDKLFFTLFIKADEAIVDGSQVFERRVLNKYLGQSKSIAFTHQKSSLTLDGCHDEEMQLIPLEGCSHFWGADYMVCYELSSIDKEYMWIINTSN
ncbi:MAG: hypothetical protein P0S95_07335 [Rhabdochlamydiaceae bacterium]|nr:hypothetical protein [Candidatus Amphrikana amoebophyrae]